ncbi:MAG: hypothetical protein SOV22_09965 [Blautia obeum]|nr:hypothetical protein [Blautia obeum]
MKRKLYFVISVFVIGILLILLIPYIFKAFEKNNVVYIEHTEMNEMLEKDEEFFLIISKEECPDCNELKDKLKKANDKKHMLYIFEYAMDRPETLISELEDIFPNFIFVPYVCYVNKGVIQEYNGRMDVNEIFEWMDNVQDNK